MKTKNIAFVSVVTIMALVAVWPVLAGVKPEQVVKGEGSAVEETEHPGLSPEERECFRAILSKSRPLTNDIDILKGIGSVWVKVEYLKPEIEKLGLTKQALQTDVELQLRKYGIEVSGQTHGFLAINVNAVTREESRTITFNIIITFMEFVVPVRNPKIVLLAPVWEKNGVGTVGKSNIKEIREGVKDYVNEFINDYLAANPKEAAAKKPETEQDSVETQ